MKKTLFLILLILLFAAPACTALPQTEPAIESYPNQSDLPRTEAEVPRVTVEEAKLALDNGEAIIVDVRSAESYAEAHLTNAISIPLGYIETDPSGLDLNKEQWIITYCT